jgi:pyridoxine kinase
VWDLLDTTLRSGRRELQLVQSQDAIAEPRMQFEVTAL